MCLQECVCVSGCMHESMHVYVCVCVSVCASECVHVRGSVCFLLLYSPHAQLQVVVSC